MDRDHRFPKTWKEARRKRAFELKQQGWKQKDIAEASAVSPAMMSGITMDVHLYTLVRDEALDSLDSVLFLQHLVPHISAKLLVIWDGSPIHNGEVRMFLADGGAKQIHVEQLPPYAPDLNSGEGFWQHLKQVEMRNLCCRNLVHLRSELDLAIKRLRRKPHLITACFAGAGLRIEI